MTAVRAAAAAAGRYLASEPFRVALDAPEIDSRLVVRRALYLAYTRAGELHYIGKVDRGRRGSARGRLAEHLRVSLRKREAWRWLYVVPLSPAMPVEDLLAAERTLIALYRPPGNVQHARPA